jgi:hypothetical protein
MSRETGSRPPVQSPVTNLLAREEAHKTLLEWAKPSALGGVLAVAE